MKRFHYSVILSIIYKQHFCGKAKILPALEFLTKEDVSTKNYLEIMEICKRHLTKQLEPFSSQQILDSIKKFDDETEKGKGICPNQIKNICLAEVKLHLKNKEWFEVQPIRHRKDMSSYFDSLRANFSCMR